MRGEHLHCRVDACARPECGELPFQIARLLPGQVWDQTVRRAPRIGLVADHAGRVQLSSIPSGCRRLYGVIESQGQHRQYHQSAKRSIFGLHNDHDSRGVAVGA